MEQRLVGDPAAEREAELVVHSIARAFGTGSVPGWPRQIGHVRVFSAPPNPGSQRQNIFVRVFS